MSKTKRKNSAYKFSMPNNKWAIVAADDDYLAKLYFMSEYNITEKEFERDNIRISLLPLTYKCNTPFFERGTTVEYILNVIKFFPRLIADSEDVNNFVNFQKDRS